MFGWLKDNIKNFGGWTTSRNLVVFNVDDYGNVRLASPDARDRLVAAGLNLSGRMDCFDAMETREDLVQLFDVLDSVKDRNGNPAKFTPYTVVANPDFARIREDGHYFHELLPVTFERLADQQKTAYQGTWKMWKEGISNGFLQPQSHGREHLNLTLLEHLLKTGNRELRVNLEQESVAGLTSKLPGIGFSTAFALTSDCAVGTTQEQLRGHQEVIESGLDAFQQVFGFHSLTFTPPAQTIHPLLYKVLENGGVKGIHKPIRCWRDLGDGKRQLEKNKTGKRSGQSHVSIVRNIVFEPTVRQSFDPVTRAMRLIEVAFRWRKPALISSHRVNFSGHINPDNRARGLKALKMLLDSIVTRWPESEFVGADQLVQIIEESAV